MATRTCRIGLHGRNNARFDELDYQVIRSAKIETLKMLGQTHPDVFRRIKDENPGIEFITRLYDDRFKVDKHPMPQEFAARQIPIMRSLQPYCTKFEIHNEPNHPQRYEGWGQEDYHAQNFNNWFLQVYALLKEACPWAQLGFPGLAIPHRDLDWIEICAPAINKADWLGVHCYWQTAPGQERNHLTDAWGLRFKFYHEKFPQKIIEITECGNSNIQANPPIPISEGDLARQFAEYYQALYRYAYINSASFFLLSSQDRNWDFFAWRSENGKVKPVVQKVGQMPRAQLIAAHPDASTWNAPGNVNVGGSFNLPSLSIRDISLSLAHNPNKQYPTRPKSAIKQIIIHHTAISEKVDAKRIAEVQVSKQGKAGIGYHYFIAGEGSVYQTNALTTLSEHTPQHNADSIAIAFAGNFTAQIPTPAQIRAGGILCASLMIDLNISPQNVVGAQELINTQSPGKQWLAGQRWKDMLFTQINLAKGTSTAPISSPIQPTPSSDMEKLAKQLSDALSANALAQQRIAILEAELAQYQNSPSSGLSQPSNADEIADLKERIASLEFQLSIARKQAVGNGTTPSTTPTIIVPKISPPTIENIAEQLAQNPNLKYPTRAESAIKMIVVHHTGVPPEITAQQIADFRVNQNHWAGIGIHFLILADGTIQQTNRLTTVSKHAGDQNPISAGVAFAGNFNDTAPTSAQISQSGHLIAWLLSKLSLPATAVVGHKAIAGTPCPGSQWDSGQKWQKTLKQSIENWLGGVGQPVDMPAPTASPKTVYHYLLLGSAQDQQSAANYINKFKPITGTDVNSALSAQYVTIVGNNAAISNADESKLRQSGCKVERMAGNSAIAIKSLMDNMARTNRRFLTFSGE